MVIWLSHDFPFIPSCVLYLYMYIQVAVFKVNTEDVFKRAKKMVEDLTEEVQTLNIQKEEVVN